MWPLSAISGGKHRTDQWAEFKKHKFLAKIKFQLFQYVYFFFREHGAEAPESGTYSRVARVCKNDMGGPRNYKYEWSSFVKMRLNCSIPQKNKNFYFDEVRVVVF